MECLIAQETICIGILHSEKLVLNLALLKDFAQELYWHNFEAFFHQETNFHLSGEIKLQLDFYSEKDYPVKSDVKAMFLFRQILEII